MYWINQAHQINSAFHCQFCDIGKVETSHVWLYTRYESYQRKTLYA
jgi:hypothetical protein